MTLGARTVQPPAFTPEDADLLRRVKEAVREVEPQADVVLYGSRARGEAREQSDWDLLILVDGTVVRERKDAIRQRLYELTLALPECPALSTIIHSRAEWDSPLFGAMPVHARIEEEGVHL